MKWLRLTKRAGPFSKRESVLINVEHAYHIEPTSSGGAKLHFVVNSGTFRTTKVVTIDVEEPFERLTQGVQATSLRSGS